MISEQTYEERWADTDRELNLLYAGIKLFHDNPKEWREANEAIIAELRYECQCVHDYRIKLNIQRLAATRARQGA